MDDIEWHITIPPAEMNRGAGASAAEKASEIRRAMPIRSMLGRVLRVHNEERAWSKGYQGERSVGKILEALPKDRWRVFHDLPLGRNGANVDHLLIGTAGVFSINTKNLSGKVWLAERALLVNGTKTDYLPKASAEARRVKRALEGATGEPVAVRPLLAVICDEMTVKACPPDIDVVRRRDLRAWLQDRERVMSLAEASRIARAAEKLSTWS